jgi:lysozyme family protein
MGAKNANKLAQRAIKAVSHIDLIEDGILGQKSIEAINYAPSNCYLSVLKSECANYYRNLNQEKFIKGWLNRAYSSL